MEKNLDLLEEDSTTQIVISIYACLKMSRTINRVC